ncbi:MAG TPA: hypothetical protein PK668_09220 [Myxococcota bacterium]|nr:hypothetical protein [Myxococcota bacterium]HRY92839.1 hypothetical protein [Myxococcota bacterium]HSA20284.1 hypothetical protein [Myxococcota bacterium]
MASHLTSIGFDAESEEEFVDLAARADEEGALVESERGAYLHWRLPCGAELWAQISAEQELVGMNPHLDGRGRMPAVLTRELAREGDSPLDGAFHAWAVAPEALADSQDGLYPFVFDCPDAARQAGRRLPARVDVQLALFAHELQVYPGLEAFEARPQDEVRLASRAFIPLGLFREESDESDRSDRSDESDEEESMALLAGHVVAVERRVNEETGRAFVWALLETLGGTVDLVADPEIAPALLQAGGVVVATGWLSGRIL